MGSQGSIYTEMTQIYEQDGEKIEHTNNYTVM